MQSMPSGGDVIAENGKIMWMQWMDREECTVILCDSLSSTISGPWKIDDIEATPYDPIVLLKKEAYFIACIKNEE